MSNFIHACRICNSSNLHTQRVVYDDRYGYPGSFEMLLCGNCGHQQLDAIFSNQELTRLYSEFYPRKFFDVNLHKPYVETKGFSSWLDGRNCATFRWVPKNVKVLDIGCGFGESLGYHQSRGCEVYGVEADTNIQRVSERYGYKVHVGLFDPDIYPQNFFDYVTMNQVIEHVTYPLNVMQGIAQVLKSGGVAILSSPNANGWGAFLFGRKWINWHTPYHLQFFSYHSMQLAANNAGLVIEKAVTITSSAWLDYQWTHLLTFPNQSESSSFWMPSKPYTRKQRIAMRLFSFLKFFKVNHLITRFFDSLNLGDNRIYFLRKP